jgi:hypothetical protein
MQIRASKLCSILLKQALRTKAAEGGVLRSKNYPEGGVLRSKNYPEGGVLRSKNYLNL